MADKKSIRAIIIPLVIGILLPLAVIILMTALASYDALVKDVDGNFFQARWLFIAGDALICGRDTADFRTRGEALESRSAGTSIAFISMKRIEAIQFISSRDDAGPALGAWQPSLKDFVGDYTINAAANHGFMSLRAGGGSLYGTIRFPDWGKGVTENLKNVRIAGGKIYFTRSVTTPSELKRTGASGYFTQEYSGEYFKSGNLIRGYYTVHGSKKWWEAVKNR